jgi:hypothetical protein
MTGSQSSFAEIARLHFGYLISEYGFHADVLAIEQSGMCVQGFTSEACHLNVRQVGSQVLVDIGPATGGDGDEQCDLCEIVTLRAPGAGFQYVFDPDAYTRDPHGYLSREMGRLAGLVRYHCGDMLQGDFRVLADLNVARSQDLARVFGPHVH